MRRSEAELTVEFLQRVGRGALLHPTGKKYGQGVIAAPLLRMVIGEPQMKLDSELVGGLVVARISGRIDQTTSEAFGAALAPVLTGCKKDAPPCVLDFTSVEYISSVGLRVLMMASRQVKTQQGKIAIAGLNPVVAEVFAITRFNLVLPCHASVEDAGKALLA